MCRIFTIKPFTTLCSKISETSSCLTRSLRHSKNRNNAFNSHLDNKEIQNSCVFKIGYIPLRCLIDTGASISLIHKRSFKTLKSVNLNKSSISLQSASGDAIRVLGKANLDVKINSPMIKHTYIIVGNLSRNAIIGKDFLSANSCRIYFDLNCIKIKDTYVSMQDDRCIASILRQTKKVQLKPMTTYKLPGKL